MPDFYFFMLEECARCHIPTYLSEDSFNLADGRVFAKFFLFPDRDRLY